MHEYEMAETRGMSTHVIEAHHGEGAVWSGGYHHRFSLLNIATWNNISDLQHTRS